MAKPFMWGICALLLSERALSGWEDFYGASHDRGCASGRLGAADGTDHHRAGRDVRIWFILIRIIRERIRRRRPLPSGSWRRFIRQPAPVPRRTRRAKNKAMDATHQLQQGRRGYLALWHHIMNVSVADLKKNYQRLDVNFRSLEGESLMQMLYIPDMVKRLKEGRICLRRSGRAGGRCKGRNRYQGDSAVHDLKI